MDTCQNAFNQRACYAAPTLDVEVLEPKRHAQAKYRLCHHHLGLLLKRVLGKNSVVKVTYIGEVFEEDFA
uniref:Uncharacterized protein n=1 Tax=viral metagenome TaxID=1070528 RepID=A0A6M3XRB2_9ZZZZ